MNELIQALNSTHAPNAWCSEPNVEPIHTVEPPTFTEPPVILDLKPYHALLSALAPEVVHPVITAALKQHGVPYINQGVIGGESVRFLEWNTTLAICVQTSVMTVATQDRGIAYHIGQSNPSLIGEMIVLVESV